MPARASFLNLHMQTAPRQVCPAGGSDSLVRSDGVSKILNSLRNYLSPEAVDAIRRQMMRRMRFRRADQSVGEYIVEFDLLYREAEPDLEMGDGFPGQSVLILRTADAALTRHDEMPDKSAVCGRGGEYAEIVWSARKWNLARCSIF